MIERKGNEYQIQCDYCSNYVEGLIDFKDAVDYKKANGWKSEKIEGEWFDKCPNC